MRHFHLFILCHSWISDVEYLSVRICLSKAESVSEVAVFVYVFVGNGASDEAFEVITDL